MTNFCFPFFFFFLIKPGSVLLPLACFKNNFANVEFLVYGLFLSALWMYHLTAFWPPWFVMWNQLLIISRVRFTPLDKSFLSLPSAFSLYLWTANLQYISFGDHTTCWLSFRYVNDLFKTNLGGLGSLSLQLLFLPLYLSACQLEHSLYRYWHAWQCLSSHRLWSFFPSFSSVPQAGQS